jgi:hypothetical protein
MTFRSLQATGDTGPPDNPLSYKTPQDGTMPKSYDSATVEFAMTLSTLAYVDDNRTATQQQMIGEINAGLEEAGYKSWQVAWGPALNADRSNLAYAARNSETGQLAVSIRGSDFSSGSTGFKTSP